ncbi:MAG TPA: arsenate reductase [Wenzhouxiangella sp.]|nr:arsenate reductase [Wenzhouxiangella sp.]
MSELRIYGIKTCDACRKALRWLDEQGREYRWQDFRADGLEAERLRRWVESIGTDSLVNRRSTTWRNLSEDERSRAADSDQAVALLLEYPTLIKRPVIEQGGGVLVGFNAAIRDRL